jgi:PAS domain S-box-containing protein
MSFSSNIFKKFKFYPSNYNILIVEDSKSVNNIMTNKFENLGYKCFSAQTLKEAYSILDEHKINFIMLDINLPDGNGYDLMKKYALSNIKIFVLTSQNDEQFRQISFQKGIIDFIVKDKDFYHRIDDITLLIEKIEKNKQSSILIVEDSFIIQEQLTDILTNRNYRTLTTEYTNNILELIENNDIDLILLDVNLKDGNGIEFLDKNKSTIIDINKIPVIIVSGNSDSSIVRNGLRAGATDIIRKPYIVEELILKVDANIDYKRKQKESINIQKLLQQYKDTIDKSYIVSRTDKHGFINYVNDAFCEISGFTKEELLGKSHSILKHQDMPSELFKELWHTVKNLKQTWQGEIKNMKKDGSFYWANTIINPIVDSNGDILEFIAIRNDISHEKLLESYFRKQLSSKEKTKTYNQ